jgi:hypothetical protein
MTNLPASTLLPDALLTDMQMVDFIIKGYILVTPSCPASLHQQVCRELDKNGTIPVDLENDPTGLELLEKSPALKEVFNDPLIHGATTSLVGHDYFIFGRYCHANGPGQGGVYWHQDDVNARHYQVRRLMFLYYPQEVTLDMGPTFVVPGTHLLNTPTDQMQAYGNIRGQIPLTVSAGTVAITHYDIWHSATRNKSLDKMRYLVKYYVDRTQEPLPEKPTWNHDPKTATPQAMQRMHHTCTAWSPSDYYKERHLRWRLWSYLLGVQGPAVWAQWQKLHPNTAKLANIHPDGFQGYIGAPMA